jgi:hypothetical protein
MYWTEPATADDSRAVLEQKLWDPANPFWSGVDLTTFGYAILESRTFASLLKTMASIDLRCSGGLRPSEANEKKPEAVSYDVFGLIYEYFLGKFAMSEGQKGGEWSGGTWTLPQERPKGERGGAHQFYTPTSIVRLIVEILEPYHGRILEQQGLPTSSRRLPQGGNSGPHFFSSSLSTLRFSRITSPKQSIA